MRAPRQRRVTRPRAGRGSPLRSRSSPPGRRDVRRAPIRRWSFAAPPAPARSASHAHRASGGRWQARLRDRRAPRPSQPRSSRGCRRVRRGSRPFRRDDRSGRRSDARGERQKEMRSPGRAFRRQRWKPPDPSHRRGPGCARSPVRPRGGARRAHRLGGQAPPTSSTLRMRACRGDQRRRRSGWSVGSRPSDRASRPFRPRVGAPSRSSRRRSRARLRGRGRRSRRPRSRVLSRAHRARRLRSQERPRVPRDVRPSRISLEQRSIRRADATRPLDAASAETTKPAHMLKGAYRRRRALACSLDSVSR